MWDGLEIFRFGERGRRASDPCAKDEDEDDDVRVSSTGFVRVVPSLSFTGGTRWTRPRTRESARAERERES